MAYFRGKPPCHQAEGSFAQLEYADEFSIYEMSRIQPGFSPDGMDDMYYAYYEDETLYVHRSWSGKPVCRIHLRGHSSGASVVEAFINEEVFRSGPPWPVGECIRDLLVDRPKDGRGHRC